VNVPVRGPVTPTAVPVKAGVEVPGVADSAVWTVTTCEPPGVSTKLAGVKVTPASAGAVTEIVPVNPLRAVADTDTVDDDPATTESDGGVTASVKSGAAWTTSVAGTLLMPPAEDWNDKVIGYVPGTVVGPACAARNAGG